jgi:hypothetical protein
MKLYLLKHILSETASARVIDDSEFVKPKMARSPSPMTTHF